MTASKEVKTARKGKTLAALEKAAMRWYGSYRWNGEAIHNISDRLWMALINAAAAHAATKKRKGTK